MALYSLKLRIASVLAGIGIAVIFTLLVLGILNYFYGDIASIGLISIILVFVLIMDVVQFLIGPYIIGRAFRTKEIGAADPNYQWILDDVKEVCISNNQKVPKVYMANVPFPNAFAYGSPLAGRRLAVTRGLVEHLERDEVKAVIAHEIGHLKHHDVALLMAIGIIPTVIFYLGYMLLFSGNRNQGGYNILIAVALMAVSFLFSIMILGVNRMRESYADMNSTTIQGGPENLQRALAKIVSYSGAPRRRRARENQSSFSSMLLFSNPNHVARGDYEQLLDQWKTARVSRLSSIFSDHPHPARRIQDLEKIK